MIGFIAAFLTTCAFVPQVIKVVKSKDTASLSLAMLAMQTTGVALWLVHGLKIGDVALWGANSITLCLTAILLAYKLRFK